MSTYTLNVIKIIRKHFFNTFKSLIDRATRNSPKKLYVQNDDRSTHFYIIINIVTLSRLNYYNRITNFDKRGIFVTSSCSIVLFSIKLNETRSTF